MTLSQEPTIIVDDKDDNKSSKSDSQELWDASHISESDLAPYMHSATQIATDKFESFKEKSVSRVELDADENPFLDRPPLRAAPLPQESSSGEPGPSRPRTPPPGETRLPSDRTCADLEDEDSIEASRVEGILAGVPDDDTPALEPEGPPATQTTASASSASNSQRSFETSFKSTRSMPTDMSEVKLGKRRATDDREPAFAPPRPKFAKVASEGDASRYALRTAQFDPGPSKAKAIKDEPPDTGIYIIAHNDKVQVWFDELRIPWGVQYEIARGIGLDRWSWTTITREKLKKLRGLNKDSAPKVAAILLDKPVPRVTPADALLWAELDREQDALVENKHRGLGLKGEWDKVPNWYGGQIQQICRLHKAEDDTPLRLMLGRMEMTRSHRFARDLGSRRLLQIKLPKEYNDRTKEKAFLSRKLVLCGRVFQVFAVKEDKAYAMEVNEDHGRAPSRSEGDFFRLTLEDFVARHNPLHLNAQQPVSKFNARFDLGLSTSKPVLQFHHPDLVKVIDDEYAPGLLDPSKVPPEKIYTDGCGYMNGAALKAIKDNLKLDTFPCAVQGRVFGSKGMWMLHPDAKHSSLHSDDLPRIWIRRSQQKVQLVADMDPRELEALPHVHFIFDLVAVPRLGTSPHLNRHTIVNLHHNGVPTVAFAERMRAGVEQTLRPLLCAHRPEEMPLLWRSVDVVEGVTRQRRLQFALGAGRVLGLASRSEVPSGDGDGDEEENEPALETAVLPLSKYSPGGKPVSIAERFMRLIGAGFTLAEEYTFDQHGKVREHVLKAMFDNLRLPLRASAEAFIVPDPTGKLQEDEIYFRSSSMPFEEAPNMYDCHLMLGDCLIYRNPARLTSDIRKVKAVDVPELALYKDVIVVPCKGSVSLPSMLAGGDVDGDTAVCIWDPVLVVPFRNAKLVLVPPGFKEANFQPEGEIVTVAQLEELMLSSEKAGRSTILQRHLVSGVSVSRTSMYSRFHDFAMYMFGYGHENTQRIALMFNFILDSRKSGIMVKPGVWTADKNAFAFDLPPCLGGSSTSGYNPQYPPREKRLGKFVIEKLQDAAKKIQDTFLAECDAQTKDRKRVQDDHITALWERYRNESYLASELKAVTDFVDARHLEWQAIWAKSPSKRNQAEYATKKEAKASRVSDEAARRAVAARFAEGPPEARTPSLRNLELLHKTMAAYAYTKSRAFAFDVAFTQLTLIKAEKCTIAPVTELISSFFAIPASSAKVLMNRLEVVGG
ncbi:RNA dependent RNA polymerase-domain-containing protein [Phanerochaete sordida]|uniref:RNA-dependent RNA polymerase n=1 Tax=Phanerochaete sordida TaxID=48140 RepID=A0A9P3G8A2_9APHY|nr:RNA dependent RNA polymerase-domain-containing protein [Phanerochaete sordida]